MSAARALRDPLGALVGNDEAAREGGVQVSQRDEFPAVEVLTIPGWAVAASAAAPTVLLTGSPR